MNVPKVIAGAAVGAAVQAALVNNGTIAATPAGTAIGGAVGAVAGAALPVRMSRTSLWIVAGLAGFYLWHNYRAQAALSNLAPTAAGSVGTGTTIIA